MSTVSKSRRPYLIRAIYEWAVDNHLTPHIVVAADAPGVSVPRQHVKDGRITLNLSPMAVQSLHLDQEPMWFAARFQGRPFDVVMPSGAILAIFARENGEGVVFGEVEPADPTAVTNPAASTTAAPAKPARPGLSVVVPGQAARDDAETPGEPTVSPASQRDEAAPSDANVDAPVPGMPAEEKATGEAPPDDNPEPPPPPPTPPRGRGHLRVVK